MALARFEEKVYQYHIIVINKISPGVLQQKYNFNLFYNN